MRNFTLIFVILLISCNSGTQLLTEEIIDPEYIIEEVEKDIYFQSVMGIFHNDDKIYVSDVSKGQIIILNEDFSHYKTLGTRGRAANEFLFTGHVNGVKDSIFIVNGNGLSLFIDNEFSRRVPKDPQASKINQQIGQFGLKFTYINGKIYYYPLNEEPRILAYDIKSDQIEPFATSKIKSQNNKNRGHVVSDNKYIYIILNNAPYIEKYSLNGDLLDTFCYLNDLNLDNTL